MTAEDGTAGSLEVAGRLDVAVIEGGPSSEAEVSRSSAAGVVAALEAAGHRARRLELGPGLALALGAASTDVVFPVVHGALGEDGCLQGMLEVSGLPYVGSGVLASALACDKIAAKVAFRAAGLPVAEEVVIARGEAAPRAARRARARLGAAVVVKPSSQGSAVGVRRIAAGAPDDDLAQAIEQAFALDDEVLCERFVVGREVTVGVLDCPAFGATRALPPTEIRAKLADFYDFRSRYAPGGSEHTCPALLPEGLGARIQGIALAAHRALGCRDLSRVDFIVGDGDEPAEITLLEVNTLPGMTPTSLYPEAARIAGVEMAELVDGLARAAKARGPRRFAAVPLPLPR